LFGLGLFNAVLVVPVTLIGGLTDSPGSAAIIFLIYGVFGVLYAALESEHSYAVIAWTVGLIALYATYGFVYRLPAIEDLEIFPGYALLIPTLVFLSAELAGKFYFRVSQAWTLPLFGLGLFNATLVIPVAFNGGLNHSFGSAAMIFLIGGLFAVSYAALDRRSERNHAVTAWTVGLIALYIAYGFFYYVLVIDTSPDDPGNYREAMFSPASAEDYYNRGNIHAEKGNYGLAISGYNRAIELDPDFTGAYYNRANAYYRQSDYAQAAANYFGIFPGFVLLVPALAFLSAELVGKLYYQISRSWTLPLLGLGILNALVVVPVTIEDGLTGSPGSAAIIFLIYGLFGVLYAALDRRSEHNYAVTAWTVGLAALYAAYMFVYRLQAVGADRDIFLGYALLVPALAFLSAELIGKLYFRARQDWTLPLLGLGLLNAVLVVPVALDGGLDSYPGSAAIIFLIYGLFGVLYIVLNARTELGYMATGSLVPALAFALVFYDQDHWVIPFVALTLVYYLGGLTLNYFYHQRDWWQVLHWSGLALGTATAFSAPVQGGGDAVVGMGVIATLYGAEAFRLRNVWVGLPANGLFLGAYLMALQELNVTEPQLYSIGMGLLAIVTHYLLTRRSEQRAAFVIGFAMGVTAQMILLGTSFIQMSIGLQFFFILFFQSLILLGYGLVIRSLSFTIIPILFVVGGVLRVVFTALAHYSTVVTLGCTGLGLVLLGITALVMRERLLTTYEEFQQSEKRSSSTMNNVLDRIRLVVESLTGLRL
jgi:tetratricopeptide (TPR) repeat protein